ncbi:MAG: signal peptidase I [Clostridia bacterium]|nr:signal peptidase I [Clostridia bacterium]
MSKKPILKETVSWILHIAIAVVISYAVVTFGFQRTVVYSYSMQPTLYEGDSLWVEKVSPKLGNISAGDIVTIYAPEVISEKGNSLIKRVIAVEGDTVEIKDGKVYVNDKIIEESYINGDYTFSQGNGFDKVTVTEGYVYVLGDNRSLNIIDSRTMGPVKTDRITGKAVFRIFPFDKFGFLN